GEGPSFFGRGEVQIPAGAAELGWAAHEQWIRDSIDSFLTEPDYSLFAALQEEAMLALVRRQPRPEARSEPVLARAEYLRGLLKSWRAHHGVSDDGRLAEVSRLA